MPSTGPCRSPYAFKSIEGWGNPRSELFFPEHRFRRIARIHVHHHVPAFVRGDPGLRFCFDREQAAVLAHLQFRRSIEIGESGEITHDLLAIATLLSLL